MSMDDSIRAIRMCDGGESVENGHTKTACDYCEAGRCRQMEACEAPRTEAETKRIEEKS